ncbi:Zn-dependent alcohol dehydrogenase [Rhodococcus olei]|uniref:Zn-dependent alcohol dehydrogenase n=1 Tax=Rhodococcus olei TaxID=2161675 RepID=A0ABP8PFB8_9NOCA
MVKAAVLTAAGGDYEIMDIELPEPGPGEVRVRLAASGVCHSDLTVGSGSAAVLPPVPTVLGHEGAGHVVSVGAGVEHVGPGDRVVLNWTPACSRCWHCRRGETHLCENAAATRHRPYAKLPDGRDVYNGLGPAAFAEETVVPAAAAIPLTVDIPLVDAALLGCSVMTGVGAVLNAARVAAGDTVAVLGLGGVGLSALQGARLAGASTVIGVDVHPGKETLAKEAGATDFLAVGPDLVAQIRELTGGRGADHVFECAGRADAVENAWSATRRGGQAVVVGLGPTTASACFPAADLMLTARSLIGCFFGSADMGRDVPRFAADLAAGRLDVSSLVTHRIGLDQIPEAFARMRSGDGGRSVIVFGDER